MLRRPSSYRRPAGCEYTERDTTYVERRKVRPVFGSFRLRKEPGRKAVSRFLIKEKFVPKHRCCWKC
eukprot:5368065-Amphidinium_carterae.1